MRQPAAGRATRWSTPTGWTKATTAPRTAISPRSAWRSCWASRWSASCGGAAFSKRSAEPKILDLLDLVALGTVADVARLKSLNRAFVTQGLKVMAARQNVGLAALVEAARLVKRADAAAISASRWVRGSTPAAASASRTWACGC